MCRNVFADTGLLMNHKGENGWALRKIFVVVIASFSFATACQPGAKRYQLRGQVMDKNLATNEITVNHEDIPGFMAGHDHAL